jgi:hypothetical protein
LRRPAFWFALALVGQAVSLQMIDAGRLIRYQHYKPLSSLLGEDLMLLPVIFFAQTLIVIAGYRSHWRGLRKVLVKNFRPWQLAAVILVFSLSSTALSRDLSFYALELLFATLVQAVNLANIVLVVLSVDKQGLASIKTFFERFLGGVEAGSEKSRKIDRFALLGAVWTVMLAGALSLFSYENHPHVPDEVAYLYHARFLAEGQLTMPAPPVQEGFGFYLMDFKGDRWFPSPPVGWPAVLAVGMFAGVPWLVNPLLAGLNVLLGYALLGELFNRRIARISLFLLCVSPWHIFMASNFMTHTFTLTCSLAAALGVVRARRTGSMTWALLSGVAVGVGVLIRPLDGLVLGVVIGLWAIGVGGERLKFPALAAFALGGSVIAVVMFGYNYLIAGHPLVFPLNAYLDKTVGPGFNDLGFGPDRGLGWALQPFPGHSPLGSMVNANLNIFSLNIELFGWATGSLILITVLFFFFRSLRKADYLMLAVIVAVFAAYFFYWYSGGPDFGARYWYLMLVPLVALSAKGIEFLADHLRSNEGEQTGARIKLAVLLLSVSALINYFPWRAVDKYYHYLLMRPDVRYLAEQHGFGKSLVLIRGNEHPDYASAAIYNPLDFNADAPIYAWDRNPEVRLKLLSAYPDRPIWVVDGPSITKSSFKVVEGPLSAREMIEQPRVENRLH